MKPKSFLLSPFSFLLPFAFCLLPSAFGQLPSAKPIKVKVAVVIQDPKLREYEGKRLHEVVKTPGRTFMWNDPYQLNKEYEAALESISHGVVQYEVVKIIDDGKFFSRRNDNNEMLSTSEMVRLLMEPDWKTLKETGTHFDYKAFVEYYGFDKLRDQNKINEVWVWSFPYGGMWESNYCGASGFWLNSEPTTTTSNKNLLVVMGLNYERKMSLALESYGHRFESVMWHLYGRWDYNAPDPNNWEKYTRFNKTHPGLANIGNIHFPPNGIHDYDWTNKTPVTSCADGWAYYPDIRSGDTRTLDCSEWDCTHDGYMRFWFSHIPHFEGLNPDDGHLNNWWHYVVKWEEAVQGERREAKGERKGERRKEEGERVGFLMTSDNPEQLSAYQFLQSYQSHPSYQPQPPQPPQQPQPSYPSYQPQQPQPSYPSHPSYQPHQSVSPSTLRSWAEGNPQAVLWYHEPDSTVDFTSKGTELTEELKKFVEKGGRLLLTLDAVRLLPLLGVETHAPTATYTKLVDEGNGRKLGLHAFRSHSVFDGMNGGAYVYAPKKDVDVRRVGWFGDQVPDGKVVAVDWAYIFLYENSKLITEYSLGKGKILAIGAYLYFDQDNFNRAHLEKFAGNVLGYLGGRKMVSQERYWDFGENKVLAEGERREAKGERDIKEGKMLGEGVEWELGESELALKAAAQPKNMWDIAGERMVLMGKEAGGIDEIWAHPVMALRDFSVVVRSGQADRTIELNLLKPMIEMRPESFTRIYTIPGGRLKEILTVHPTDGNAVVHYEYTGTGSIELNIRFKSNLRFMWPYSEKVTGEIHYQWDPDLNGWVIHDKSGDFATVVGTNGTLTAHAGNPDKDLKVALGLTLVLEPAGKADVIIGTSATGVTEAVSAYRRASMKPSAIYLAAKDYAASLFNGKLTITGTDPDFNIGYKWALVGTDRFIVNTPGVGRSLVAGYATTDYGWNGAQKVNGRPGYAWYFGRDAVWSGFAVLDYGDFDRVRTILELFSRYQDISGKIYHELTTSGIAHYDAADATPLYIVLAGKYLHHSGDTAFIRKEWPALKKAIDFCYSTDTDGDHLIENTQQGHGWEEGGDLYVTHTTQYMVACWAEALQQAAYMAKYLGINELQTKYSNEAQIVLGKLNQEFWNSTTGFFNHGIFKDGTYLAEPSVMTAIPVAWKQITMPYKSESVMDQIASCNFTTDWGTRIVSEKAKFFAPGGYHTGSVWPLFTGWASLGDFAAGKPDQGYSKLMSNLLIYKNWSLGYIEEVLHGTQYKYFGVCRHQCWSETMVIQPSIDGMLGFTPDAMNHRTGITLDFPMDWNESQADNLRVGDHLFSVKQSRTPQKTTITLMQTAGSGENAPALKIDLKARVLKGARVDQVLLNGTAVPFVKPATNEPYVGISLALNQVQNIEIVHSGGIGVLPVVHHPLPGDSSKGIKILSDELIGNKYVVKVEGLSGTTGEIRINRAGNITFEKFTLPAGKEKYSRKDLVFYESQPEAEIIYYVLPRSFYDTNGDLTGDLKGLTQKLDYLQELGVTSLLMLPLYESEFYHNYFATDYRKIDPEYGSMEDLVTLFREAHKRDMKVYLDMETQYVTEGSEWYTSKSDYQIKGTPWGNLRGYDGIQRGMNMANVNNPDVRRYFFNLYAYFLDPNGDGNFEDGADGFRIDHIMDDLDNTGKLTNLYADYWKPLFNHLKTINPDIRIVGEQANWFSFGDEIFSKADIDGVFAFPLCISIAQMTKDLIQRMADTTDLLTPGNKEQLIFIENHDLDRFASRVGGSLPKEKVGAAFNLLLKGVPLIYYGQELGMKGIKYEGKDDGNDIPRREAFEWYKSTEGPGMSHWYKDSGPWWDNRNSQSGDGISLEEQKAAPGSLWNFYRSLISLRKSEPALTGGEQRFVANDNPGVITFLRYLGGDVLLVAVNLTDKPQTVNLLEKIQLTGKVIFTEPAGAGIRQNRLTLKPYGVSVIR